MMEYSERDAMWDAQYYLRCAYENAFRQYALLSEDKQTSGFYRKQAEDMLVKAADVLGYYLVKREEKKKAA